MVSPLNMMMKQLFGRVCSTYLLLYSAGSGTTSTDLLADAKSWLRPASEQLQGVSPDDGGGDSKSAPDDGGDSKSAPDDGGDSKSPMPSRRFRSTTAKSNLRVVPMDNKPNIIRGQVSGDANDYTEQQQDLHDINSVFHDEKEQDLGKKVEQYHDEYDQPSPPSNIILRGTRRTTLKNDFGGVRSSSSKNFLLRKRSNAMTTTTSSTTSLSTTSIQQKMFREASPPVVEDGDGQTEGQQIMVVGEVDVTDVTVVTTRGSSGSTRSREQEESHSSQMSRTSSSTAMISEGLHDFFTTTTGRVSSMFNFRFSAPSMLSTAPFFSTASTSSTDAAGTTTADNSEKIFPEAQDVDGHGQEVDAEVGEPPSPPRRPENLRGALLPSSRQMNNATNATDRNYKNATRTEDSTTTSATEDATSTTLLSGDYRHNTNGTSSSCTPSCIGVNKNKLHETEQVVTTRSFRSSRSMNKSHNAQGDASLAVGVNPPRDESETYQVANGVVMSMLQRMTQSVTEYLYNRNKLDQGTHVDEGSESERMGCCEDLWDCSENKDKKNRKSKNKDKRARAAPAPEVVKSKAAPRNGQPVAEIKEATPPPPDEGKQPAKINKPSLKKGSKEQSQPPIATLSNVKKKILKISPKGKKPKQGGAEAEQGNIVATEGEERHTEAQHTDAADRSEQLHTSTSKKAKTPAPPKHVEEKNKKAKEDQLARQKEQREAKLRKEQEALAKQQQAQEALRVQQEEIDRQKFQAQQDELARQQQAQQQAEEQRAVAEQQAQHQAAQQAQQHHGVPEEVQQEQAAAQVSSGEVTKRVCMYSLGMYLDDWTRFPPEQSGLTFVIPQGDGIGVPVPPLGSAERNQLDAQLRRADEWGHRHHPGKRFYVMFGYYPRISEFTEKAPLDPSNPDKHGHGFTGLLPGHFMTFSDIARDEEKGDYGAAEFGSASWMFPVNTQPSYHRLHDWAEGWVPEVPRGQITLYVYGKPPNLTPVEELFGPANDLLCREHPGYTYRSETTHTIQTTERHFLPLGKFLDAQMQHDSLDAALSWTVLAAYKVEEDMPADRN
ncbi:unnamed protein product [Amoebophrya sp. A25]|nr:unnamed protein product [Amoebophrya sp. A25]|eukprot:GSA25T00021838001.1